MRAFRLSLLEVYRELQRHLIDDDRIADKLEYEIDGLDELIDQMKSEWRALEDRRRRTRGQARRAVDDNIESIRGMIHRALKRRDYRELKLKVLRAEQAGVAGMPSKNQMRHDQALAAEFS